MRVRGARIVMFAAAVIVGGCGADEPKPSDAPAAQTRAVSADFARRCARDAGRVAVDVLCPARLPDGDFEAPRNYGDAPCSYLINLEPRGFAKRAGTVFHVLFGGTCEPSDLRTRGGRWPATLTAAARSGDDLRLVGVTALVPGDSEADAKRVGLTVLRHARVGSSPALVLRNPPYPTGGIHGGHIRVIWNAGGAGDAVTGHAPASAQRADATLRPRNLRRATRTLLGVAASMRPSREPPQ